MLDIYAVKPLVHECIIPKCCHHIHTQGSGRWWELEPIPASYSQEAVEVARTNVNLIIFIVIFIIKHWKHLCLCLSVVCITLALKSMYTHFVCLACAYMHVWVLKAVYLFPLRTACLRYWVSLPALQMLPLTFLDCSLLIMRARFPPGCRCSYGLVSSSYWLPAKPKAGGTLIKDT